jgi:putative toxin-antitoxin system antitoxin component (TIGR02293 family)
MRAEVIKLKSKTTKVKGAGSGVVRFYVKGSSYRSKTNKFSPSKIIEMLQKGLPFGELEDLQGILEVPAEKLAAMLRISKATFHRRKGSAGTLPAAVADRVVRYARLLGLACKVFDDDLGAAKQWLNAPQFGLGGAVPLEYAKTEIGAREVECLLGRIEYGVYS